MKYLKPANIVIAIGLLLLLVPLTWQLPSREISPQDIIIYSAKYSMEENLRGATTVDDLCDRCQSYGDCFYYMIAKISWDLDYPRPAQCIWYLDDEYHNHRVEYYPLPLVSGRPGDFYYHAHLNQSNSFKVCCTSRSTPEPVCKSFILQAKCP